MFHINPPHQSSLQLQFDTAGCWPGMLWPDAVLARVSWISSENAMVGCFVAPPPGLGVLIYPTSSPADDILRSRQLDSSSPSRAPLADMSALPWLLSPLPVASGAADGRGGRDLSSKVWAVRRGGCGGSARRVGRFGGGRHLQQNETSRPQKQIESSKYF